MNKNTVSVLGEEYTIHLLNPEDDAALNRCQGYTDESTHEIVHAFFFESGLGGESDYAQNEELVDWIARQGPKLYRAWAEAGAL